MFFATNRITQRCICCVFNATVSKRVSPKTPFARLGYVRLLSITPPLLRGKSKHKASPKHAKGAGDASYAKRPENTPPRIALPKVSWVGGGSSIAGSLRTFDRRMKTEIDMHEVTKHRLRTIEKRINTLWEEELRETAITLHETKLLFELFTNQVLGQDFDAVGDWSPEDFNGEISDDIRDLYIPSPARIKFYHQKGEQVLDSFIRDSFYSFAVEEDPVQIKSRERILDLRYPHEWYPESRAVPRKWIVHVGPTNSGKTYRALKRLEECDTGIYAGPLRLLAHEIYERFNAKGIPCNLVTGEEQRVEHENPRVVSSTVEMIDLNRIVDVAVLDEIQMIGDSQRGWAWTQALLGVKAKEVHLCGEERTVELIQNLANLTGDELIINQYQRLGPLFTANESLNGDLSLVERGDCVVTFSRKDIFALKRTIEEKTGKRVAVVYGGLPPETRSQQAKLFNEHGNEYDVLVASDAIGMGLNLAIQRVIFETLYKFDGKERKMLEIPQIKQIAGRAGRFKVAPHSPSTSDNKNAVPPLGPLPPPANPGIATTLEKLDLPNLQRAMKANAAPIRTAGIHPPDRIIERFAKTFETRKPFSNILAKLAIDANINSDLFHLCSLDDQTYIAGVIDNVKRLSVKERITITQAPLPKKDPDVKDHLVKYATLIAESKSGSILDVQGLNIDILDEVSVSAAEGQSTILSAAKMLQNHKSYDLLPHLETLHKTTMLWLWLSYRFPSTFVPRDTAFELKRLTEHAIQQSLDDMRYNRTKKLKLKLRHERTVLPDVETDDFSDEEDETTTARATA